jgi:acyl-CoA synthetase (AMP-forming)/AMP-acid ligase II
MMSRRTPVEIPPESLTYPLRQAARRWPDKTALIEPEAGGRAWTFAQLERDSARLAGALVQAGVTPGQRVALCLKNSAAYVLGFYGILKAGAVVVPLSTHYGPQELAQTLALSQAVGLLAEERVWRLPGPWGQGLRLRVAEGDAALGGVRSLEEMLAHPPGEDLSRGLDPDASLAVLPFSSGTTGLPKAVMLSHKNLLGNLHQNVAARQLDDRDVMLNQLPFFHIYGMTALMGAAIQVGALQVVVSRFQPVEDFLDLMARYRPTVLLTVPLVVQELCQQPRLKHLDHSRLRYVNTSAAPLAPELQERFKLITGVPVTQGYGLTETSPTTHVNPQEHIKVGSIGTPVALTEQRISDPSTLEELPVGQVGELWIRGPQVMQGYYQDPQATAAALVDGWLRTGDLARQDQEGYVFIVDRLKELIKTKGFQVAPAELEHALLAHPDILDAAVVGLPHPDLGEAPVAHVVRRPGSALSEEETIAHAAQGLARYKRLNQVVFCEAIPRSASGKILRRVLKQEHQPALIDKP